MTVPSTEELPPTRGVLTALLAEEVAALGAMGLGAPLVLPAEFLEATPASLQTLRDHLLVDESGNPLPWFAAVWSCVVQPRVIGVVSRTVGDVEYAWLYYLRTSGFVEQVNGPGQLALLGAPLDELPERLVLAAGLLRDRSTEPSSPVPALAGPFGLSVRFTRVGGPTLAADFEFTGNRWERSGLAIEPARVAAEIEAGLSSAFDAEPLDTGDGE